MLDPRDLPDGVKNAVDGLSVASLVGYLLSVLPAVTTVMVFVWTLFRLLESRIAIALIRKGLGFDLERWMKGDAGDA